MKTHIFVEGVSGCGQEVLLKQISREPEYVFRTCPVQWRDEPKLIAWTIKALFACLNEDDDNGSDVTTVFHFRSFMAGLVYSFVNRAIRNSANDLTALFVETVESVFDGLSTDEWAGKREWFTVVCLPDDKTLHQCYHALSKEKHEISLFELRMETYFYGLLFNVLRTKHCMRVYAYNPWASGFVAPEWLTPEYLQGMIGVRIIGKLEDDRHTKARTVIPPFLPSIDQYCTDCIESTLQANTKEQRIIHKLCDKYWSSLVHTTRDDMEKLIKLLYVECFVSKQPINETAVSLISMFYRSLREILVNRGENKKNILCSSCRIYPCIEDEIFDCNM